ncbi:MAG TPA: hypothetical protein VLT33_43900 [Labilithrix sp.]|nr:hypothetical protein [Labilithrix sp.]
MTAGWPPSLRACLATAALLAACGRPEGSGAGSTVAPAPSPSPTTTTTSPRDAAADAPPKRPALHHVLGTGQSLASGVGGSPPLSLAQPFDNRMFGTGALAGRSGLTSFVPLVERDVETMSSSFANLVTKLARDAGGQHDLLLSVHALGGAPYRLMKKGTGPYAVSLAQATAAAALARDLGLAHDVTAVTSADGGGDHVDRNTHLADDLAEWQRDLEADLQLITGQSTPIPLFITQYSSWTEYDTTSPIPLAQLRAHVDHPGKVIMVGPRYPFLYGPDGVHLTNEGYRGMGEYYARAYRRVVVEHGTWEPLRPKTITRAGAVITARFLVPAPPLVLDTTLAEAAKDGAMGFEYADDGPASPTIASVALTAPDTVTVTLSAEPTAAHRRLRYAFTGALAAHAGLQTGARGNLHDSYAAALPNWCVHFDEDVP